MRLKTLIYLVLLTAGCAGQRSVGPMPTPPLPPVDRSEPWFSDYPYTGDHLVRIELRDSDGDIVLQATTPKFLWKEGTRPGPSATELPIGCYTLEALTQWRTRTDAWDPLVVTTLRLTEDGWIMPGGEVQLLLIDAGSGALWRRDEPDESPRNAPEQVLIAGFVRDAVGDAPLLSRFDSVRVDPSGRLEECSSPEKVAAI